MGKWVLEIEDTIGENGTSDLKIKADFVATDEDLEKGPLSAPPSLGVGVSVLSYLGISAIPTHASPDGGINWVVDRPIVVMSNGGEV